ncbi:hypothetical protein BC937DRAFT_93491 [Endogone sp. FLAS-F59071]|nr:hypothetical protein BC937DRAFT_93491 [Endogone sp. FLAS-F59071]|eukprot:RUS14669.1 hypothetical protein BC937DRAFT_93491 [Endogone sp. FLAS-F59071]
MYHTGLFVFPFALSITVMWWATFVHLILWAISVMAAEYARPIVASVFLNIRDDDRDGDGLPELSMLIAKRVKRVAQLATTGFIMLFSATVITELGYGGTQITAIIAWLFVTMTIGLLIMTLLVDKPIASIPLQMVSYSLIITLFSLSFRDYEHPRHSYGKHGNSF